MIKRESQSALSRAGARVLILFFYCLTVKHSQASPALLLQTHTCLMVVNQLHVTYLSDIQYIPLRTFLQEGLSLFLSLCLRVDSFSRCSQKAEIYEGFSKACRGGAQRSRWANKSRVISLESISNTSQSLITPWEKGQRFTARSGHHSTSLEPSCLIQSLNNNT